MVFDVAPTGHVLALCGVEHTDSETVRGRSVDLFHRPIGLSSSARTLRGHYAARVFSNHLRAGGWSEAMTTG